ncbi:MAG: sulfur carrier protein ThiS adenylyltransferase ThiF [Actinomycetota bacterium]|nr:sulfur carrier protein ThiS adenylyltransferase ThiF [Actinomycetota bacterium]MDZ4178879.1 sulfur carrier protein ThiS adenylyltransferase ThiF [Coriobacteriia bacterium]
MIREPTHDDGDPAAIPDEAAVRSRLAASSAAIIGCGGLGSNIAAMLLRSGIGSLILIDHDVVEPSNLNRQLFFLDQIGRPKIEALADTLRRINPNANLTLLNETVNAENLEALVGGADVIVEAVDGAETKAVIVNTWAAWLQETPLVTASGLAGCDSANCISTEPLADNCWLTGDQTSDVRAGHILLASRVMVAAAHQAHAAIRFLLGYEEP